MDSSSTPTRSIEHDDEDTNSSFDSKKRKKNSEAWKEFILVEGKNFPDNKDRAKCVHCEKNYIAESTHGTTNLNRHLKVCRPRMLKIANVEKRVAKPFDQEGYKEHLALAVIRHGYTFTFVEHEENRKLHIYLNEDVKPISRNTMKKHCLAIHKKEMARVKESLKEIGGICLTSDMWTSCVTQGYLCLTIHYVDKDWKLCSKILNFCHLPPPHSAAALFEKVYELIQFWGIEKKICTITLDNARANDNMQALLCDQLSSSGNLICNERLFHVRCGAHVLNLIVQEGLKVIDNSVYRLREAVKYVTGSEGKELKFYECAKRKACDCSKSLWLDCPTRWNSTFLLLERALGYRRAFDALSVTDNNFVWGLTNDEWARVTKICNLLKPFNNISTLFSGISYPTSNLYFINVWKIQLFLLEEQKSEDSCISEMSGRMLKKFEKYWDCYSVVLSFAIVLDPRYKLAFVIFCFQKLDTITALEKWTSIKTKLYDLFAEYTSKYSSIVRESQEDLMHDQIGMDIDINKEFDDYADANLKDKSELDLYLDEKKLSASISLDILSWWKENTFRFPVLSIMAKDILSIPITTVASESAFSMGGRILNKWRASLLPDNAEALITTRNWLYGFEDNGENQENMGIELPLNSHLNLDLISIDSSNVSEDRIREENYNEGINIDFSGSDIFKN